MKWRNALLAALLLPLVTWAGIVMHGARVAASAPGGGEFSHGDTVEITGTGFGAGPTTSFLQPEIEATANGATLDLPSDSWIDPDAGLSSGDYQGYTDAVRGLAVRASSPGGGNPNNHVITWDRGSNTVTDEFLYFTWWTRAQTLGPDFPTELDDQGGTDDPGPGDDSVNWQWKLARWRFDNDVLDASASGDSYTAHWDNSDGSFFMAETGAFEWINGVDSPFVNGVSGRRAGGDDLPTAYTQVWSRVEWFWFMGDTGTGRTRMYVTHEGGSRNLVGVASGQSWFASGRVYRFLVLQNYWGNIDEEPDADFAGSELAMDDCYAQRGNLKRVELTNHETLGSETWREIQDPSSWTDTSIEVTLNTGAGRTGQAWLKVIETNLTTGAETELGSLEITISSLFEGGAANDDLLVRAA